MSTPVRGFHGTGNHYRVGMYHRATGNYSQWMKRGFAGDVLSALAWVENFAGVLKLFGVEFRLASEFHATTLRWFDSGAVCSPIGLRSKFGQYAYSVRHAVRG